MKTILLIGKIDDIARSLHECLIDTYNVQICSENVEHIQGMCRITNPAMVIVCQVSQDDEDATVFDFFNGQTKKAPLLLITSRESWATEARRHLETVTFDYLLRPVTKDMVLEKCKRLLDDKSDLNSADKEVRKRKVLLVDDSPVLLRNVRALLEPKYKVFLANSGKKALQILKEREIDVVLLDYIMPGMDGLEVYNQILGDEYTCNIPVIFLTGVNQKQKALEVLQTMPFGYVLKPPDREELEDRIEEAVAGTI